MPEYVTVHKRVCNVCGREFWEEVQSHLGTQNCQAQIIHVQTSEVTQQTRANRNKPMWALHSLQKHKDNSNCFAQKSSYDRNTHYISEFVICNNAATCKFIVKQPNATLGSVIRFLLDVD